MIAVFDYGAGNLRSVQNTLEEVGAQFEVVRDAAGLERASKIVLPGVGHFGQMMRSLTVQDTLRQRIAAGVPFLGICLGTRDVSECRSGCRKGITPGTRATAYRAFCAHTCH